MFRLTKINYGKLTEDNSAEIGDHLDSLLPARTYTFNVYAHFFG